MTPRIIPLIRQRAGSEGENTGTMRYAALHRAAGPKKNPRLAVCAAESASENSGRSSSLRYHEPCDYNDGDDRVVDGDGNAEQGGDQPPAECIRRLHRKEARGYRPDPRNWLYRSTVEDRCSGICDNESGKEEQAGERGDRGERSWCAAKLGHSARDENVPHDENRRHRYIGDGRACGHCSVRLTRPEPRRHAMRWQASSHRI